MIQWSQPTKNGLVWGHSNYLPEPHRELILEEFFRLMFCNSYCMEGINFSQVYLPGKATNAIYDCNYFFWHRYGIAVVKTWFDNDKPLKFNSTIAIPFYENNNFRSSLMTGFKFFRLGCEHKNMGRKDFGNCDHEDHCLDCDYRLGYNSGD